MQHLYAIAKQTGKIPKELDYPKVHPAAVRIKQIFDDLSKSRQFNNGHPMLLSSQDIYYWCKLRNIKLNQGDLDAIRKLDISQINSINKAIRENNS